MLEIFVLYIFLCYIIHIFQSGGDEMRRIIIFFSLLTCAAFFSCSIIEHTPCQENCEYNRRDCVQLCGDPDKAGFNIKLGGRWEIGSVDSCIRDCSRKSDECIERCRTTPEKENTPDE